MKERVLAVGVSVVVLSLVGCCTPPPPKAGEPSVPSSEGPPSEVEQKVEPVVMPATIDEAASEGFLVCRRDGDVRIVGIRELKDGKCLLVYDNRLSGNGTQNVLPNLPACELQQLRMKQNFTRSGFRCE